MYVHVCRHMHACMQSIKVGVRKVLLDPTLNDSMYTRVRCDVSFELLFNLNAKFFSSFFFEKKSNAKFPFAAGFKNKFISIEM